MLLAKCCQQFFVCVLHSAVLSKNQQSDFVFIVFAAYFLCLPWHLPHVKLRRITSANSKARPYSQTYSLFVFLVNNGFRLTVKDLSCWYLLLPSMQGSLEHKEQTSLLCFACMDSIIKYL